MSVDKLVDSGQLDLDLTDIADAIRERGDTSATLNFEQGFVDAINALSIYKGFLNDDVAHFKSSTIYPIRFNDIKIEFTQSGSGTPSPDNVRSIKTYNNIRIEQSGLNMQTGYGAANNVYISTKYIQPFGLHTTTSDYKKSRGIYLRAGNTIRIHFEIPESQKRVIGVYGCRYNSTAQISISTTSANPSARYIVDTTYTPSYSDYYSFWVYTTSPNWNGVNATNSYFQIQYTNDAFIEYEAPSYSKQTVSFGSEIASGVIDATNGCIIKTGVVDTFTGAETEGIELIMTEARAGFYLFPSNTFKAGMTTSTDLIANICAYSNTAQSTSADDDIITINATIASNKILLYTPLSIASNVSELRTYLNSHNLQVYYPIDNEAITITPMNELIMKNGYNNIWNNITGSNIEYIKPGF